jgi:drug/metabolite transporter, DME family
MSGGAQPGDPPADGGRSARWAVLAAAALFSTGGTVIKATTLAPQSIAGLRAGIAALALLVLLRPPRSAFRPVVFAVALCQALQMSAFVAANKLTTAANAIFLQSTAPIYVALLSFWLPGERVRREDLGVLAAFGFGSALIFLGREAPRATAPDPWMGDLLAAVSGFFWALTVTGLRRLASSGEATGASATAAVVAANGLAFLLWSPWLPELVAPPGVGLRDVLAVLWLGVFQVGIAYVCLTAAMRRVRALEASLLLLAEPVLATGWAALVHGEVPGGAAAGGAVVVLLASLVQIFRRSSRSDSPSGLS